MLQSEPIAMSGPAALATAAEALKSDFRDPA